MKTILFADNIPEILEVRAEFLLREGFEVILAYSPQQVRELLEKRRVHLAILDIRLVNDEEIEFSGLELAEDEAYAPLPKIMLTSYPDMETIRRSLIQRLGRLPTAVDFLSKKEGPDALVIAVRKAFDEYVRINWDLRIDWRAGDRFSIVNALYPGVEAERFLNLTEEFEDLLRRLFYEKDQIRIERQLWQRDGRVALVVFASQRGSVAESCVLVCGPRPKMLAEQRNYKRYAPKAPGDNGTMLSASAETLRFGALIYALPNANLETVQSLSELYRSGPEKDFRTVLLTIYQKSLADWQKERLVPEETRVRDEIYRARLKLNSENFNRPAFEARQQAILRQLPGLGAHLTADGKQLNVHLPRQSFSYPDPAEVLFQPAMHGRPVTLVNTPGLLSGRNVLTDSGEHAWLTDFSEAGLAPSLWDYVTLEAEIRFDWAETKDLLRLHELERCLSGEGFTQLDSMSVEPVVRKAVRAIQALRQLVPSAAGHDEPTYHRALLYHAASRLIDSDPSALFTDSDLARLAHLLMAIAILGERLFPQAPLARQIVEKAPGHLRLDSMERSGLRVDRKNGEVWVDGERKAVRGQSFDLLCYLYEHRNQLCGREDILKAVFEVSEITQYDEGRLTTAIHRLREKIELDPDIPRYLITVPGHGYRLLVTEEQ